MSRRGMFVVLEGLDAAGKATQSKELVRNLGGAALFSFPDYESITGKAIKRHLLERIQMVEHRTRDSSDMSVDGDPYTVKAEEDSLVFQCLMHANKSEAATPIRQRLADGIDVVADRWTPSAFAFGTADGLPERWLDETSLVLPQPDICIFIDVNPQEAQRRRPELRDRYEKDRVKQALVRANYEKLWAAKRWPVVDGHADIPTVTERIWSTVVARAPKDWTRLGTR